MKSQNRSDMFANKKNGTLLILILPHFLGLNGIWLSFPVADQVTFIITMSFVFVELKKIPKMEKADYPATIPTPIASSKVQI